MRVYHPQGRKVMGGKWGRSMSDFGRDSDALNGSLATEGRVHLPVLEFDRLRTVHTFSLSINSSLQNISQNFFNL